MVALNDRAPIGQSSAAQRVNANAQARRRNGLHINHTAKVADIGRDVIMAVDACTCQGAGDRHAFDCAIARGEQRVGRALNGTRHVGIGRATMGRVIFETAIIGRIMRRADNNAVSATPIAPGFTTLIIGEDGVRDDRGRRIAALVIDHGLNAIGGEHFEGGAKSRFGQSMRIHAKKQRAGDADAGAMIANGLGDGEDMGLVKAGRERVATMT